MADRDYRYAEGFLTAIINAKYEDNTPVQYTVSGFDIIISNWTDIKTLDKTAISTQAAIYGFTVLY